MKKLFIQVVTKLLMSLAMFQFAFTQHDEFNIRVISDHIYAQHLYRDKLLKDPYRPTYHYVIPEGMAHPFDPNGAFFWKGRYHLFYIIQTVRPKPYYRGDAWAHVSSHDLIHWRHHPTALKPTEDSPERAIYSGNLFLNKDGVPTIMYQGLGAGNCIAYSEGDEWLEYWKRHEENPVIPYPEYKLDNDQAEYRTILNKFPDYDKYDIWDPHCWIEGDTYYAISGNNDLWPGQEALFKSKDLTEWELLGDFFHHDRVDKTLDCPDFFKLGDKYVLLYLRKGLEYVIGDFRNEQFYPEKKGTMTWNIGAGYAPESMLDDKGRRIMWAALNDSRTGWGDVDTYMPGHAWSGTMSIPRVLTLDEQNNLLMEPVEELKTLRTGYKKLENLNIKDSQTLEEIAGNSMELKIVMKNGKAHAFGVKVAASGDGQEETVLKYLPNEGKFQVDLTKSSLNEEFMRGYLWDEDKIQIADLRLNEGEDLEMQIFIDRSVLEVFVNKKLALVQRIYPTLKSSNKVVLFSEEGATQVPIVESWNMNPSNPY